MTTNTLSFASSYMSSLANAEFWGTLEVKFERGAIVHLVKHENIKPQSVMESAPKPDDRTNRGLQTAPQGDSHDPSDHRTTPR